jgi:HlyD family secretion protein
VVSSLNAPSLFLIARDLTRIQVWVSVNEADIGRIHPGQPVSFTVDAYPGEIFQGEVGKVRLNATMTQNVVTYTVEVNTDNSDSRLLPYLTANVNFIVGESKNVLMVPNAALRWVPQPEQIVLGFQDQTKKTKAKKASATAQGKPTAKPVKEEQTRGVLWIPQGNLVRPVRVRLGLSDGAVTEVEAPELKEDAVVVVGEMESQQAANGKPAPSGSPFTPQLFRGAAQPQGPGQGRQGPASR